MKNEIQQNPNVKILIVCVSTYKGNTAKLAHAMASVLKAEVVKPEQVDMSTLKEYSVIGFGAGINFTRHNPTLMKFVDDLPKLEKKAFIFSTRGNIRLGAYHKELKEKLKNKGFELIGEFSTKGYDATGPFRRLGGVNKGRPNDGDIEKAKSFAQNLGMISLPMNYYKNREPEITSEPLKDEKYKAVNTNSKAAFHGTKVVVDWNKCIGCGKCVKECPLEIFNMKEIVEHSNSYKRAEAIREIDCIQCLMCQSFCPSNAIDIKGNWLDALKVVWRHKSR